MGCTASGDDDVHVETDELRCEIGKPVFFALGKAVLDQDILPLHVAKLTQPILECLVVGFGERWCGWSEQAYPGDVGQLLRLGGKRRCEQVQSERDDTRDGTTPHGHLL